MAIDTSQKRAALISFISPFPYPIPVTPDGSVDEIDRGALAGIYQDQPTATLTAGSNDFPLIWFFIDG